MFDEPPRRTVLRRLAVAGSVGLAGCSGDQDRQTNSSTTATETTIETPTDSPTPSPTDEQPSETDTPEQTCPEPTGVSPRWRRETGARNFEPVVSDGTVYVGSGSGDGHLRAVSLAEGADQWRTPADGMLFAPPTLDSESVYATDYGQVTAFARSDGSERWRHETIGDIPRPVAATDGLVCFGESNHPTPQTTVDDQFDRVVALDGDGTVRWRTRFAPAVRAPVATTPVVAGDTVIAGSDDSTVRAFDREDGSQLWSCSVSDPRDAVAFDVGGTNAVAVASRGGVQTLAVSDGRTLWRDGISVDRVAFGGGRVFATSNDDLRSLDANDGTILWRRSEFEGRLVGVVADAPRLLVSSESEDGTLQVSRIARETGCVLQTFETDGRWLSPPALGEHLAVVATGRADRSVYAVETGGD